MAATIKDFEQFLDMRVLGTSEVPLTAVLREITMQSPLYVKFVDKKSQKCLIASSPSLSPSVKGKIAAAMMGALRNRDENEVTSGCVSYTEDDEDCLVELKFFRIGHHGNVITRSGSVDNGGFDLYCWYPAELLVNVPEAALLKLHWTIAEKCLKLTADNLEASCCVGFLKNLL